MESIRAESVVKTFGNIRALDGISLPIEPGELFFLLGASGCGKTTLLRCIAGLETPTSGTIFFGDRDVTNMPPHKREAAMVFQSYALWPHLTVGQNIAFGLEERRVPKPEIKRRVEEALEMVQLPGYRRPLDRPDVRRPAAAGFAGPRAGGETEVPAARRTAFQSRRPAPRGDAPRNPPHREGKRPDRDLRHPRSGGGAGDGRPDGGAHPRKDRPDRHAGGNLPRSAQRLRREFHRRNQSDRRRAPSRPATGSRWSNTAAGPHRRADHRSGLDARAGRSRATFHPPRSMAAPQGRRATTRSPETSSSAAISANASNIGSRPPSAASRSWK